MLVKFPSVRLSDTGISNRQTDGRKITEGDRADGLTIRQIHRHLTFYSRIIFFSAWIYGPSGQNPVSYCDERHHHCQSGLGADSGRY